MQPVWKAGRAVSSEMLCDCVSQVRRAWSKGVDPAPIQPSSAVVPHPTTKRALPISMATREAFLTMEAGLRGFALTCKRKHASLAREGD